MNITAYIHPIRTYLPCTGVGRHINNIVLGLADKPEVNVELLFSKQWLGVDGKLDSRSPLRELPARTFPTPENLTERSWKLLGWPKLDRYLPKQTNWLYAPAETYLPASICPVAITLHDINAFEPELLWSNSWRHRWFRYKWRRWVGRAVKESRIVFTVSEFSKQRLIELAGVDPAKLVVIGNGVSRAFFEVADHPPAERSQSGASPYILIVGGLRKKKGAEYVLAVAKQLLDQKSELKILVTSESESEYTVRAQDYPNITLLGMVPDEELPGLMRNAVALLFLSLYEGFGIPALEAMAAGIPVIVSNRASLPEIVGDAGIVVEPNATGEVVDIITNLVNNPALHQKYSRLGPPRAAQYTWSSCVDRVIEAFHHFA